MRSNEQQLYIQESQASPNRYVSIALCLLTCVLAVILLLNEVGLFLVEKVRMRYCMAAAMGVMELPLLMTASDKLLHNPKSKYILLLGAQVSIFIVCTMICFHTFLALALPLLLGAQYPSRRICRMAVVGSLLCAVFSPVCSMLFGCWDNDFLQYLLQMGLRAEFTIQPGKPVTDMACLKSVLMYISLPHAMTIAGFYPLIRSMTRHGEERLQNEIKVLHMGQSDALTGLLNRHSFEQRVDQGVDASHFSMTCLYVDANDLHRINNEHGHDAGDKMLCSVASAMVEAFGDEQVFRIGGDEFVTLAPDLSTAEAWERAMKMKDRVEADGYSVSLGMEYATVPCSIRPLIRSAEVKMQCDKEKYHIVRC